MQRNVHSFMLATLLVGATLLQAQHATAELVSDITAVKLGDSFLAGVVIRTEPGWHVYWSNPGDSGTPTSITWKLPEGWTAGPILWPTPSRFTEGEMVTYGYEGSTLLLTRLTPPAGVQKGRFVVEAHVKWLACKEACVAGSADLRLDRSVNENTYEHPVWFERLAAAEKALPQPAQDWTVSARQIEGGYVVTAKPPVPLLPGSSMPTFFASEAGVVEAGAPQNFRINEDGSIMIALKAAELGGNTPERLKGILIAPKAVYWKDNIDTVLIDVPIPPKGGN